MGFLRKKTRKRFTSAFSIIGGVLVSFVRDFTWGFGTPKIKWIYGTPWRVQRRGEEVSIKISSLSREFVRVPVTAFEGGDLVDPTTDVVEMAFKIGGEPSGGDWKTADWETDNSANTPIYYARCLVGPGAALTLTDGTYDIFVRVYDAPEVPVGKVGKLVVD